MKRGCKSVTRKYWGVRCDQTYCFKGLDSKHPFFLYMLSQKHKYTDIFQISSFLPEKWPHPKNYTRINNPLKLPNTSLCFLWLEDNRRWAQQHKFHQCSLSQEISQHLPMLLCWRCAPATTKIPLPSFHFQPYWDKKDTPHAGPILQDFFCHITLVSFLRYCQVNYTLDSSE